MRLGFAAKVLGPNKQGLPAADLRRRQNNPNLGRSLELANVALDWIQACEIEFWRLPSGLAPYGTHPQWSEFWHQEKTWVKELTSFGQRLEGMRITSHPGQYTVLNSPRQEVVQSAIRELELEARLMDCMGIDPGQGVIVLHIGGKYSEPEAAKQRFVQTVEGLSVAIKSRLVLENDDRVWSSDEVLSICQEVGLPMVFDLHHHRCHNPQDVDITQILPQALATWGSRKPKVHLSSPRSIENMRPHAAQISDEDWSWCCQVLNGADVDVMLEAKDKDWAVLDLASRINKGSLPRPTALVNLPIIGK